MNIRLLLVDDHTVIREGLASLLEGAGGITVVGEAGSGREALEKVKVLVPEVVIMDLTLPDMGGIQVTRRILAEYPGIKVLVLTMFLDDNCVVESLDAGARGYLVKDCAAEELVAAVHSIYHGKPYFCAEVQEIMMRRCVKGSSALPDKPLLTKRETEVLLMTARGLSIKEIAFELGVSVKMIEVHRMNVRKKLDLHSIAELTTYALKTGLITV